MNAAQLRAYVAGYQPMGMLKQLGLKISVGPVRGAHHIEVRATVRVPDTYYSTDTTEITRVALMPPDPTPEQVNRAVWAAVVDLLCHEAGECLTRNGAPVFDPHTLPRSWPWA